MIGRFLATLALITFIADGITWAQSSEEKAVVDVIEQLFKGMENSDSSMVRASFANEVTMATVRRDKENNPLLTRESSIDGFLKAVGTPHPETWYEEIWNVKVQIDGDFAQVWCDYAFYVGKKFSHCGVDAFHLHREKQGWKIFHLTDTRRSTGCVIPDDVQAKHK